MQQGLTNLTKRNCCLFKQTELCIISLDYLLQPVAKMLRHSHEKTDLSCFKSLLVTGLRDIILTSLSFKVVHPSFVYGLVLLPTFIRGGGGIKSTRSWTGHLCHLYGTVSHVLLQLVVAFVITLQISFLTNVYDLKK